MNVMKAIELGKQYTTCPDCGNENVGNGEGTLIITDNTFERTCKCGFKVKITSGSKAA